MSWQVVRLAGGELVVLAAGLSHDLALVLRDHFLVGAMPGELIQIRLDPARVLH